MNSERNRSFMMLLGMFLIVCGVSTLPMRVNQLVDVVRSDLTS